MRNIFLFIFLLISTSTPFLLKGQYDAKPWSVGIHPGLYSFYATGGNQFFNPKVYGGGLEISAMRTVWKYIDVGAELNFARLAHPAEPETASSALAGDYSNLENFFSFHLAGKFRFDGGIIKPGSILVPFLKLGLGTQSTGNFKNWFLYIPVGAGLHAHIPKTPLTATFQLTYNPTLLMGENVRPMGFIHYSLGIGIRFGNEKSTKKTSSSITDIKINSKYDHDYDGVPDSLDKCPHLFGSKITMGCPDTDNDQIMDSEDKCPEIWGYTNLQGCLDSDRDGIVDTEDQCPDLYGEDNGCPYGNTGKDDDADGIPNNEDLCPQLKGIFTAYGCPDGDGDGVRDEIDLCPDFFGSSMYNGCPFAKSKLDSLKLVNKKAKDQENIAKYGYTAIQSDLLMDRFGNLISIDRYGNIVDQNGKKITLRGGYAIDKGLLVDAQLHVITIGKDGMLYDHNGLLIRGTDALLTENTAAEDENKSTNTSNPDKKINLSQCDQIDLEPLRTAIYFEYNKANPNAIKGLEKVIEAMRKCALIELEISGHTDADGDEKYNLKLSEKRAKAIMNYLTNKGINKERLKFNAFGEQMPVAPNDDDEGKSRNRRAEIRLYRSR